VQKVGFVKLDLAHRSETRRQPLRVFSSKGVVWRGRIWSVVGGSADLAARVMCPRADASQLSRRRLAMKDRRAGERGRSRSPRAGGSRRRGEIISECVVGFTGVGKRPVRNL
jgi:hypothetical protein